ncbi:MAG TPA: DUF692 domain-containing protein [Acidimicrobiales bacterium]
MTTSTGTLIDAIPFLGAGLGYRVEIAAEIHRHADEIDWLEIIAEKFLGRGGGHAALLAQLRELRPVVPHGISLSIGTAEPTAADVDYERDLCALADAVDAPYVSDHICFTRADGVEALQLMPLPRTREAVDVIARRARRLQQALARPIVLENISNAYDPASTMSETDFIEAVVEEAGCGLLLDLANVCNNAANYHFDPMEYVDALPLERVVQVHLAGGHWDGRWMQDSHSTSVKDDVWQLFEHVTSRTVVRAAMVERDQAFPEDFEQLLDEVRRIKAVLSRPASVSAR